VKLHGIGMKVLFGLLAAVAVFAVGASGAVAKGHPQIHWESSLNARVGQSIEMKWGLNGATPLKGSTVILQEELPTGAFKTVRNLGEPKYYLGEGTLPARKKLGRYGYRVAVTRKGKIITQEKVTIGVFGRVPLSTLFADQSDWGGAGVYSFPGGRFKYAASVPIPALGEQTLFTVAAEHCTAIKLEYMLAGSGLKVHVIDPQRGHIQAISEAAGDTLETLEGLYKVDRPWSVVAIVRGQGEFPTSMYLNGSASCDSTEPF
jgi:hypothetical protein